MQVITKVPDHEVSPGYPSRSPAAKRQGSSNGRDEQLSGVFQHIGNTPLIRLRSVARSLPPDVQLFAKAEFMNPGGSVKDRAAGYIIREALANGTLGNGKRLLDATSGNTGIAYAMLCASLGIPVTLAMPENASEERKLLLKSYGAELLLTDKLEGTDGAQRFVKELAERSPDRYTYTDQYNNDANWRAHYETTGPELIRQTAGEVTHFISGLGTAGTFTGTVRRLRQYNSELVAVAVQPDSPMHAIEGMKHMESAIVPGIYTPSLIDETLTCSTDEARRMTLRLAREEGLLVGVSSGANVAAALRYASGLTSGTVVTVLCDTGSRYLSEPFWNDESAENHAV